MEVMIVNVAIAVVSLIVLYFLIKAAVREGMVEAQQKLKNLENEKDVNSFLREKDIRINADGTWNCLRCGKLNKKEATTCSKCLLPIGQKG